MPTSFVWRGSSLPLPTRPREAVGIEREGCRHGGVRSAASPVSLSVHGAGHRDRPARSRAESTRSTKEAFGALSIRPRAQGGASPEPAGAGRRTRGQAPRSLLEDEGRPSSSWTSRRRRVEHPAAVRCRSSSVRVCRSQGYVRTEMLRRARAFVGGSLRAFRARWRHGAASVVYRVGNRDVQRHSGAERGSLSVCRQRGRKCNSGSRL